MDIPGGRTIGVDMVLAARDTKTFEGDISVSASGLSFGVRFCDLVCRSVRLGRGLSQGETVPDAITLCALRGSTGGLHWFRLARAKLHH